jgi:hypothetical protein
MIRDLILPVGFELVNVSGRQYNPSYRETNLNRAVKPVAQCGNP